MCVLLPCAGDWGGALGRGPAGSRRAAGRLAGSAAQPGIRLYLPVESILNRKNLPFTTSPLEVNLIGWLRMVVASFVFLIAASTLARLGVWPDLQTDAIASSITCCAANTGGPYVPKLPDLALAAAAIAASAG